MLLLLAICVASINIVYSSAPQYYMEDGMLSVQQRNAAFQRGNTAYLRGDLRRAVDEWKKANYGADANTGTSFHAPALANLAFVQFALLGLHEEGLNSYIRAINLEPWNLDIHVNLSGVLAQLGNFSEALRTLQHLQGIHDRICIVGTDEYKKASPMQLSTCVQLNSNIASALKHQPNLQRSSSFLQNHSHYLDAALSFAVAALNRETVLRVQRKCSVKLVRLSQLDQHQGTSCENTKFRSGLMQRTVLAKVKMGHTFGQFTPFDSIAVSPYLQSIKSKRLEHLSASAAPEDQSMMYVERYVYVANFSRVVMVSPSVKDGEPIIIDPSRCIIYARYNDQLPSAWWKSNNRIFLGNTVSQPYQSSNNSSYKCDAYFRRAATPTQRWTGNYFHFIVEFCVRLVGLMESEALRSDPHLPIVVPAFSDGSRNIPFIGQALELLLGGFQEGEQNHRSKDYPVRPTSKVVFTKNGRPIFQHPPNGDFRFCFKSLLTLDWSPFKDDPRPGYDPNPPRYLLHRARERFLASVGFDNDGLKNLQSRRVIYVSRADVSSRNVANEAALIRALNETLFDDDSQLPLELLVFSAGMYELKNTVRLFSTAFAIVGIHGAGLTNMLFMPFQSRVLELALPEPCFRDYMHLAAVMDHTYAAMVLPPMAYEATIHIDIKEAAAHLKALVTTAS